MDFFLALERLLVQFINRIGTNKIITNRQGEPYNFPYQTNIVWEILFHVRILFVKDDPLLLLIVQVHLTLISIK